MRRPGSMRLALVFLAGLAALVPSAVRAQAAATPVPSPSGGAAYLENLRRAREESWFQREVRRYATYGHLDRAYRRLNAGDVEGAAADMRRYLAEQPEDVEVRRSLATILYRLGRYPEVLEETSALLAAAPGQPQALMLRAQSQRALEKTEAAIATFWEIARLADVEPTDRAFALGSIVDLAFAEQKWPVALEALDVEAKETDDFTVHFRRGIVLENVDRGRAVAAYGKALERAATDADKLRAELAIAEAEVKRRNSAGARRAFQKALELDPSSIRILRSLADLAYADKDYPAAAEWRRKILEIEPTTADREFLANVLVDGGDPSGAAGELEKLLGEVSDAGERRRLLLRLGNVYAQAGKSAEAQAAFQQALALGADPEALAAVAAAAEHAGRFDVAAASLQELLRRQPSADTHFRLGVLNTRLKKREDAIAQFREALHGTLERAQRAHAYEQLGYLLDDVKRYREAREALAQAAELDPRPQVLRALAEVDLKVEAPAEAAQHLARSLQGAPSSPETSRSYERLGNLFVRLKRVPEAEDAFRRALAGRPGDAGLHRSLGNVLFELERWSDALGEFEAAAGQRADGTLLVSIGRCYEKLGKPGLAVRSFERALPRLAALDAGEQKQVYDALGALYAAEAQNERALQVFEKSLALVPDDPEIELRVGIVLLAAGRLDEAWHRLDRLDAGKLPPQRQADRLDTLAQIDRREQRFGESILDLEQALTLAPAPEREYQIGLSYRDLGRSREAVEHLQRAHLHFERAHEEDPANNRYAEALGYAYQDVGRPSEAIPLFEGVLASDPDYLTLYEDLGYLHMQAADNERATQWFAKALDNRPLYPVHSDEEEKALAERLERIRKEILKVDRRFDFTAYLALRDEQLPQVQTPAGLAGGALQSQGGVELAWRPPQIGFRDERIFQVFGRVLWNVRPNSLDFDEHSYQGGVGVRYKPLKPLNLFLSVERLFRIGRNADNNWLLQALYSFDDGFDLEPGKRWWNYSLLFGDVAYRVEQPTRGWSYFVEGRQGATLNFADRFLVSPHLMADARYEDPYHRAGSYAEIGPGVSLRLLINRAGYERSSIEILGHYKWGEFLARDFGTSGDGFDGWVVTSVVRF